MIYAHIWSSKYAATCMNMALNNSVDIQLLSDWMAAILSTDSMPASSTNCEMYLNELRSVLNQNHAPDYTQH